MRTVSILLLVSCLPFCSFSQSFYLKLGGGYSFPLGASSLGVNSTEIEHLETDPETGYYVFKVYEEEDEEVRGTFNTGALPSLTAGYRITNTVGVELNFGYVFGEKHSANFRAEQVLDNQQVLHSSYSTTSWESSNAFLSPAIVLTSERGKIRPYLSAGPLLCFTEIEAEGKNFSDFDNTADLYEYKTLYSGGRGLGVRGVAGLEISLGERMRIFSEAAFVGMSYAPDKSETLMYKINGVDHVPFWTVRQREVRYRRKLTTLAPNAEVSSNVPGEQIRQYFNYNSLSVLAGVKVTF